MSEALPILDLRTKPTEAGIELKAGSSVFAVVDPQNPGTCGPYFTDRSRAILWGFYTSISNPLLTPRSLKANSLLLESRHWWRQGIVATEWLFPINQRVILEIVLNRSVTFSDLMIDPNPFAYVNYRYGAHDPASKRVQLNLDNDNVSLTVRQFADDTSWLSRSQPKITYYGLMTMFPQTHTKSPQRTGVPGWIASSAVGVLDANRSFENLFTPLIAPRVLPEDYHETVVEVGIRIHASAELTAARYYYVVDWERMWLFFTAWLYQRISVAQINQLFPLVMEQVSPTASKTALPAITKIINLDANVVSIIIKHAPTLKDAIALLSINRHLRFRIYQQALIQSNLRIRFLPTRDKFFSILPNQESPERRPFLGLPRKNNKSDKWWVAGGLLFNEDFDEINLEPHMVLPLIRASNSFIAMFGMLYSLNHYSTLPRLTTLILNHNDSHGTASVRLNATARMPEYMPTGQLTALQMIEATTTMDYPHTISLIGSRGSWLHDITMPYFFLEPSFANKLQNAKAFEKQRYDITMYYLRLEKSAGRGGVKPEITPSHREALATPLINQLFLYRGETTVAYVSCYMASGMSDDIHKRVATPVNQRTNYVEILVNYDRLQPSNADFLMSNDLAQAYNTLHPSTYSRTILSYGDFQPHPSLVNPVSPYEVLDADTIMSIRFDLSRTVNVDNAYYQAYMYLIAVIRYLIHREHLTSSRWTLNF